MELNSTKGLQSNKLQSIIEKHQLFPKYTLALAPIYIGKKNFQNIGFLQ